MIVKWSEHEIVVIEIACKTLKRSAITPEQVTNYAMIEKCIECLTSYKYDRTWKSIESKLYGLGLFNSDCRSNRK